MIRTLLATTAIATLLTAGVIAQDVTPAPADQVPTDAAPATEAPATEAPAAPADTTTTTTTTTTSTSILATGYTTTDKDNLATEIIGKQVYSSTAADAEHIGDVNNLVVGEGGQVEAVIIGVGGFLGIGQKNVAVNYSELQWVVAEDNTERFVLPTTKEALESAPDFEAVDETPPPAADGTPAPVDNGAMAPADNGAMAPAEPAPAAPAQ